ncbi:MAG: hypothetical protein U0Q55_19905, partial [Vicinamibacterales bacterium]
LTMPDFNVRSDAVNVEQIMEQIRARIREKRGVDYTEAEIRELASVKLEKFLDPRGVRSDLLEQFRKAQPPYAPPELPNYAFEDQTLFESTRGPLRLVRRLLQPILKLFFNPNPLIQALNIQSKLNASLAEREAKRDAARYAFDQLHYEVMHNLVLETTRLGIEVKNLKMRLESLASRLEFNERRARALESAVVYKPAVDDRTGRGDEARREESRRDDGRRDERREERRDERRHEPRRQERPDRQERQERQERPDPPARPQPAPAAATVEVGAESAPPADAVATDAAQAQPAPEGPGQRSRRRRRRRGRRGSGAAAAVMGGPQAAGDPGTDNEELGGSDDTESDVEGENAADDAPEAAADAAAVPADVRQVRPEPIEHAFGAQAHPAEPASHDPVSEPVEAPAPQAQPSSQEPTAQDPSATPEQ